MLSALGTAIIVALIGYGLYLGMRVEMRTHADTSVALISLRSAPPPPRPRIIKPRLGHAAGRASPPNLRNKATPIVAPPPIVPPLPSPVIVAPIAGTGSAASTGASDRPGPGQGAGGQGNGTGSGDEGNGDGDSGGDVGPRQVKGRIKSSDLPADLDHANFRGTVSVRYHVEVDGQVGDCAVAGSSGNAELDRLTCQLIQQRFRFKPAHDHYGHPFRSTVEEDHHWDIDDDSGDADADRISTPPRNR